MYAVFQISGFQYSANVGDTLRIPLQNSDTGDKLDINEVLLIKKDEDTLVGQPFIEKRQD